MLRIYREDILARLRKQMPGIPQEQAALRAEKILYETDPRLEQNVLEWVKGEPISDVWVGKYCIAAILDIRGSQDFLDALDAMNLYLQDPEKGEILIWRARR